METPVGRLHFRLILSTNRRRPMQDWALTGRKQPTPQAPNFARHPETAVASLHFRQPIPEAQNFVP